MPTNSGLNESERKIYDAYDEALKKICSLEKEIEHLKDKKICSLEKEIEHLKDEREKFRKYIEKSASQFVDIL